MKKILSLLFFIAILVSCNEEKSITVTVSNGTALDRNEEIIETINVDDLIEKLQMKDPDEFIVLDSDNRQVSYQITSNGKLIFPATVKANGESVYTIKIGKPETFDVRACGRHYPERVDDIAWENDRIAFRTYGPALQATGERAFGYDVWVKNVEEPVVEERYAMELNPETLAKINSLKKVDPEAARELRAATSYHVDHGNGLDCYKVGPTLGGGTAALYVDENIIYPYCYDEYMILDNGPLRFTVSLTYKPLTVEGNENVIENRVITLDKGSQLNKAHIRYINLDKTVPVVTGLVLHHKEGDGQYTADATKGYISYVDPTDNETVDPTDNETVDNGVIYVGAVFPNKMTNAKAVFFSPKEAEDRGAYGHVLGISDYEPGTWYTYYFGGGWSKYGFSSLEEWNKYLEEYVEKVRNPLTVTIQ